MLELSDVVTRAWNNCTKIEWRMKATRDMIPIPRAHLCALKLEVERTFKAGVVKKRLTELTELNGHHAQKRQ